MFWFNNSLTLELSAPLGKDAKSLLADFNIPSWEAKHFWYNTTQDVVYLVLRWVGGNDMHGRFPTFYMADNFWDLLFAFQCIVTPSLQEMVLGRICSLGSKAFPFRENLYWTVLQTHFIQSCLPCKCKIIYMNISLKMALNRC